MIKNLKNMQDLKKILMAKGKKKKPGEKSPIAKMVRT